MSTTTKADTDYGLQNSLAPNKQFRTLYSKQMRQEKIINGSERPCDYEMQGANSSSAQTHTQPALYLPQMQCRVHNPPVDHSDAIHIVF